MLSYSQQIVISQSALQYQGQIMMVTSILYAGIKILYQKNKLNLIHIQWLPQRKRMALLHKQIWLIILLILTEPLLAALIIDFEALRPHQKKELDANNVLN